MNRTFMLHNVDSEEISSLSGNITTIDKENNYHIRIWPIRQLNYGAANTKAKLLWHDASWRILASSKSAWLIHSLRECYIRYKELTCRISWLEYLAIPLFKENGLRSTSLYELWDQATLTSRIISSKARQKAFDEFGLHYIKRDLCISPELGGDLTTVGVIWAMNMRFYTMKRMSKF